jgi:NADH-quinone oxidoreductase chain I
VTVAYFKDAYVGLKSLFLGMKVTARNFVRKPVTLRYPHDKLEMSKAFRSAIELVRFAESNSHDCVACLQCAKICPSACIVVDGDKPEGLRKKRATVFTVDFNLCSLCGLCLDVCPTNTLQWSKRYELAGYDPRAFVFDLLDDYRAFEPEYLVQARAELEREAKEKAAAAAAKKKAAEAAATAEAGAAPRPQAEKAGVA